MSKEKFENKNAANSALTNKGKRIFKRRNKMKVLFATGGLVAGISITAGVCCRVLNKPNPAPVIQDKYIQAYCYGSLRSGIYTETNIKVTSVGITLPTSGNEGIIGLPKDINANWEDDGIIKLSGTHAIPETIEITILVSDVSTKTSLTIVPNERAYLTAYCDSLFHVGVGSLATIHVIGVDIVLPEVGTNIGIEGLPDEIIAKWEAGGKILLSGIPIIENTILVTIKCKDINGNEVSTQTTVIISKQANAYITAYSVGVLYIGVESTMNIIVNAVGVTLPAEGTPVKVSWLPAGITAVWGNKYISLVGTPTSANRSPANYLITIYVDNFYTEVTIPIGISQKVSYVELTDGNKKEFYGDLTPLNNFCTTEDDIIINGNETIPKSSISSITIGDDYAHTSVLGDNFLYNFQSLISVDMGKLKSLTKVGDNWLSGCTSLNSIWVNNITWKNDFSEVNFAKDVQPSGTIYSSSYTDGMEWQKGGLSNWIIRTYS